MANRLIKEQSPYLLQHAHNPVDWYPWGDEAFARAASANKAVIVSIGYAACHWCHVMEHESFENDSVAAYMNEHFICIKVDREEHPDVDHMYMDAVQAIGGSGGWPLNVFVTPERAPFYGGTYYPPVPLFNRPSWMQVLQRIADIWQNQNEEATTQAGQMIQHLQQASLQEAGGGAEDRSKDLCLKIADNLLRQADKEKGGFGNAPKFPGTMAITYLLEHYHFTGHKPSSDHALHSLDCMIAGGIYDQVAGGFSRYATDRNWLIPHFEKMLYDNALLVTVLCDAFQLTGHSRYKDTIEATLTFTERELKDESGGYYCALDADSEGEEGKFYTWTWEQWAAVFGEDNQMLMQYFGVTEEGNWEGTNILHTARSIEDIAASFDCSAAYVKKKIEDAKSKLMAIRSKRVRPGTDDKCLLSWNALMNIALSRAGIALGNEKYILQAAEHMEWMERIYNVNGRLQHTWKKGEAKIPAMLDDHAYLVQAMLRLASASGNNKWIIKAAALIDIMIAEFSDGDTFFYYTSSAQDHLPVRKIDLYDGATPSANAVMADNLWLCGICTERGEWVLRAHRMLQNNSGRTLRYSNSFGYWAFLLQRHTEGMRTVVCTGPGAAESCRSLQKNYNPQVFALTLEKEIFKIPLFEKKFFADKLHIFVCTEQACLPPVHSVAAAISLLKS